MHFAVNLAVNPAANLEVYSAVVGRVELAGSAIREDCSAQVRLVRASDAAIHPLRGELQRLADLR